MTTIVVMNIGVLITNDDYSRHDHYRAVSALYPAAILHATHKIMKRLVIVTSCNLRPLRPYVLYVHTSFTSFTSMR